uniref:(California timema) hypothetical protein n=1 Tax=Timema californicum TaxID=61474 RepID=A0A7R9IYP4_TIMCA|nr:unnamed protein product [Timema californicum]
MLQTPVIVGLVVRYDLHRTCSFAAEPSTPGVPDSNYRKAPFHAAPRHYPPHSHTSNGVVGWEELPRRLIDAPWTLSAVKCKRIVDAPWTLSSTDARVSLSHNHVVDFPPPLIPVYGRFQDLSPPRAPHRRDRDAHHGPEQDAPRGSRVLPQRAQQGRHDEEDGAEDLRLQDRGGITTPSSPERDLNLGLPALGSLTQHETSALDNCATEAGYIRSNPGIVENIVLG